MSHSLDGNVSKSILFFISSVISGKGIIGFGSVIVRQFQRDAFHAPQIIVGFLRPRCQTVGFSFLEGGEEIQTEFVVGKIKLVNQSKSELFRVEFQTRFGILDAQHGLLPSGTTGNYICAAGHSER